MKTKGKEKGNAGNGNAPVYQKRIGAVRTSVWRNEVDGRSYFNFNVTRRYRDGDEWKDSPTLNNCVDALAAIEGLTRCVGFVSDYEDELSAHDGDE